LYPNNLEIVNLNNFILKGDICYSRSPSALVVKEQACLVCIEGKSAGVFERIPGEYESLPVIDFSHHLILPGLVDLHTHAPQYGFRALGMDLELLEWLETRAFPEEAKFADLDYARKAYRLLVEDLIRSPNTRFCFFGSLHVPATLLLMELLEESGLVSYVGKVNMDRNAPDNLREQSAAASARDTRSWLEHCGSFTNCKPILTPRFIPSCSDDLLRELSRIQGEFALPVQSHLSENRKEIAWVRELCPESRNYADAYHRFHLVGEGIPAILAHCVWTSPEEADLLRQWGTFIAHCPQSNTNISSGIAPVRLFLDRGIPLGLGSDIAGGDQVSIFRAMKSAVEVSKLRNCLGYPNLPALSLEEVFYLGTAGGGAFFGQVGSFEGGSELDCIVIDDRRLEAPFPLSLRERLERAICLSEDRDLTAKYVRGKRLF